MVERVWFLRLSLFTLACWFGIASAASGQEYRHPGRVLSYENGTPVGASIKAWPQSRKTGSDGDCSRYGDSTLDSKTSSTEDGRFELRINEAKRTYTVTYCTADYVPRDDLDLPNDRNGEPVIPTPVYLWPRTPQFPQVSPHLSSTPSTPSITESVKRRIIHALNELSYLRKVSPENFSIAFDELHTVVSETSKNHAELILTLRRVVQDWNQERNH